VAKKAAQEDKFPKISQKPLSTFSFIVSPIKIELDLKVSKNLKNLSIIVLNEFITINIPLTPQYFILTTFFLKTPFLLFQILYLIIL
jgi:hypothetical protein